MSDSLVTELPCLLLPFGHPHYLFDAPRMPCVVNAYSAIDAVQQAAVRRIFRSTLRSACARTLHDMNGARHG